MPQLIPFYYINSWTITVFAITLMTYIMSVYILPNFTFILITRQYIAKL